ncbi:uncharacterized protein LAESUDRAFT_722266 [Laetiporus sulphureus 93-53]|uniref:Dopa 4,5-dioxygenase n=1 Tax=Laetiporus sulphureus 93-53 TaxID=1314785 RepID=A0A165GBG1_9APHY|nr:uncharacterized protein LAESUDRAFT_722266 [Laetiporus sulphureus 93-53]KZT10110.1 hypothetical protein LAESUDRAFT_722266 [Laetiporus sulphureus 93-53]
MPSTWKSPLEGYENAEPLPMTMHPDGETYYNPPGPKSTAYDEFPKPIEMKDSGFDFHVYFVQHSPSESRYAQELLELIRREFPELRTRKLWDKPIGPHPVGQFEVNTFTPHQTGALFAWLVVNRGSCSVLVHPNTGNWLRDHTELVSWMGKPYPLYTNIINDERGANGSP